MGSLRAVIDASRHEVTEPKRLWRPENADSSDSGPFVSSENCLQSDGMGTDKRSFECGLVHPKTAVASWAATKGCSK